MKLTLAYLVLTLLTSSISCFSQKLAKDSIKIQKFIKEESQGKSVPGFFVISDAEKVEFISRYIDAKRAEEKQKQEDRLTKRNSTLGRRYKNGDKSTIPQILSILRSGRKEKISTLLDELDNDYFANETAPLSLDPEVKSELFKLINDKELEHTIIQFLGINKVEGHADLFEQHLVSGKAVKKDRLFFWLGRDGKSEKAIDYFISEIEKGNINDENNYWFTTGLNDFLENGPEPVKKKIMDFSFGYMEKNPVTMADLIKKQKEDEDLLFGHFEPKFYFLELILQSDDKRVPEFSDKIVASMSKLMLKKDREDLKNAMQFNLMRFYDFAKKKEIVLNTPATKEDFIDNMYVISKDKALLEDKDVAAYLLSKYEALGFSNDYETEQFVGFFSDFTPETFKEISVASVKSGELREKINLYFQLATQTLAETNDYLYKNGLIASPITPEQTQKLSKDEIIATGEGAIYSSLELSGISHNFDAEPGVYPADHDVLLMDLANRSKGKISGLKVYQQSRYNEKSESSAVHLFAVYNNKCFVMMPEDFGDWYDLETFHGYLDAIVTEANIKERYVSVNTGDQIAWYIFGEPAKVQKLIEDFKLAYTEEEGEE